MTKKIGLRHLCFLSFLGLVLWASQYIALDKIAQQLQQPVASVPDTFASAVPETAQDLMESDTTLTMSVMAETSVLPDALEPTRKAATTPEQAMDTVEMASLTKPESNASMHLPEPHQTQAAPTPDAAQPKEPASGGKTEDPAYAGDQTGSAVPGLAINPPAPDRLVSLLREGQFSLWVRTELGGIYWYIPNPDADATQLSTFLAQGTLVRDPRSSGVQTRHPNGDKLREISLTASSQWLPLFLLQDVLLDSVGHTSAIEGGLRASPDLDTQMVRTQLAVLDQLGLSDGVQSNGFTMTGCWDHSGTFTIAEAIDLSTRQRVYAGKSCHL